MAAVYYFLKHSYGYKRRPLGGLLDLIWVLVAQHVQFVKISNCTL